MVVRAGHIHLELLRCNLALSTTRDKYVLSNDTSTIEVIEILNDSFVDVFFHLQLKKHSTIGICKLKNI